jgi:hypothetical protein
MFWVLGFTWVQIQSCTTYGELLLDHGKSTPGLSVMKKKKKKKGFG